MKLLFIGFLFFTNIALAVSQVNDVARDGNVKVFLLGGQSNIVGQADPSGLPTSPVNLQQPQDDILFYYGGAHLSAYTFTTLRPGSGGSSDKTGTFGPEVSFGRKVADASPSVTYALIKYGANGTALYNDWAPETGSQYTAFRNTVSAGLAALHAAGHTTEIVGMLWQQGESDAIELQHDNYETNLTAFIADIRSNYGANLPFLIGEIRRKNTPTNTVADAQMAVAAADPYATFVPAADLNFLDNWHFDAASMIILGERFAQSYIDTFKSDINTQILLQEEMDKLNFQHYPNPFSNAMEITFTVNEISEIGISIFNLNGKLVRTMGNKSYPKGKNTIVFKRDDLPQGAYILHAHIGEEVRTGKFIITTMGRK